MFCIVSFSFDEVSGCVPLILKREMMVVPLALENLSLSKACGRCVLLLYVSLGSLGKVFHSLQKCYSLDIYSICIVVTAMQWAGCLSVRLGPGHIYGVKP